MSRHIRALAFLTLFSFLASSSQATTVVMVINRTDWIAVFTDAFGFVGDDVDADTIYSKTEKLGSRTLLVMTGARCFVSDSTPPEGIDLASKIDWFRDKMSIEEYRQALIEKCPPVQSFVLDPSRSTAKARRRLERVLASCGLGIAQHDTWFKSLAASTAQVVEFSQESSCSAFDFLDYSSTLTPTENLETLIGVMSGCWKVSRDVAQLGSSNPCVETSNRADFYVISMSEQGGAWHPSVEHLVLDPNDAAHKVAAKLVQSNTNPKASRTRTRPQPATRLASSHSWRVRDDPIALPHLLTPGEPGSEQTIVSIGQNQYLHLISSGLARLFEKRIDFQRAKSSFVGNRSVVDYLDSLEPLHTGLRRGIPPTQRSRATRGLQLLSSPEEDDALGRDAALIFGCRLLKFQMEMMEYPQPFASVILDSDRSKVSWPSPAAQITGHLIHAADGRVSIKKTVWTGYDKPCTSPD